MRPSFHGCAKRARYGNRIGGICTASWALAKAGLLDGKRATIHWENFNAMAEDFPEVDLSRSVFVVDGARVTPRGALPRWT